MLTMPTSTKVEVTASPNSVNIEKLSEPIQKLLSLVIT
jgi:hypothetical protein